MVLFIDEYMTSQTCAKCFSRFDPRTKRQRFKVCKECVPRDYAGIALHPPKIISQKSKQQMYFKRLREAAGQNDVNQPVGQAQNRAPQPRLASKIQVFVKKMLNDAGEFVLNGMPTTTNWHRDIVAAKCIMYKGMYRYNNY